MLDAEFERRRNADQEHEKILMILQRIENAQIDMEKQLIGRAYIDDKVSALDKTINGNGTIGMKKELNNAQADLQEIKKDLTRFTWAAGVAIAAMIGQAVLRVFTN